MKSLEVESIEKKELEYDLRKKLERVEADDQAKEKGQVKRLEEKLKTKVDQLKATSIEFQQLKQKIDHKDKELEEVRNQSKQKLEEELQRIQKETEQHHKMEKERTDKEWTNLQALKATEFETLEREIERLKAEVNLKEQSLQEQREHFEAQLHHKADYDVSTKE